MVWILIILKIVLHLCFIYPITIFLITQRNEYRGSSYTSWWHALSSLDTPGKLNYCTSTAFPQKQKEKKGDNCIPAIWGWEVIQPTGKTQVFNDAKWCLILPSFSPGEWYLQSLDFSLPHCIIPEERNIFWAKKISWNIEVKNFAGNSVSNITMLKGRIRLHMVQGAGGCLKVIPFHHISQADLNS